MTETSVSKTSVTFAAPTELVLDNSPAPPTFVYATPPTPPPNVTPSFKFKPGTIVLMVIGFVAFLFMIMVVLYYGIRRHRQRLKKAAPTVDVDGALLNSTESTRPTVTPGARSTPTPVPSRATPKPGHRATPTSSRRTPTPTSHNPRATPTSIRRPPVANLHSTRPNLAPLKIPPIPDEDDAFSVSEVRSIRSTLSSGRGLRFPKPPSSARSGSLRASITAAEAALNRATRPDLFPESPILGSLGSMSWGRRTPRAESPISMKLPPARRADSAGVGSPYTSASFPSTPIRRGADAV
ncbi:hypothetical protein FPQ18DRAFT_378352 [Pyronema domesticum]|uniref:Uncharacterized protein n=1 Tax=Pyronema omphalodes (strain CBS 100304) TaxID=1076935 RepID=U4LH63_PYROM|nr:hypothetical protein FPQ18DRAFT_378352 [Pyronema domesticum]CCX30847.1 Protein of unknown function [Pyronema omphalodes CBS 100304]